MDVGAVLFIAVALVFIAATILLLLSSGIARLESSVGILSDGIPAGNPAPAWRLMDVQGVFRRSPTHEKWQLLVFADYSLGSFPLVVAGMNSLSGESDLEVLLLSRDGPEFCAAIADGLNIQVPVVPVTENLYHQFRVRVMPFVFLIDSSGTVHWSGLVNSDAQMSHMWRTVRKVDSEIKLARR